LAGWLILRQTDYMKRLIFLPFVLLLSIASMAQDKYVEVVVSDTLLVEPQEWILFLNIEKNYDYAVADTIYSSTIDTVPYTPPSPPPMPVEKPGTSLEQLSTLVKKFGGKILRDSTSVNYTLVASHGYSDNSAKNYLSVSFNSRKALENFLREAKKLGDVESQVTGTLNPKLQDFQIALEKKLVAAARARAARLADLAGGKLGNVILVSEVTETEGGSLKNFLETMMKLDFDRKSYALQMNPDKIKLEKSLKVRFAIL
jgi:hypothetical protein